MAHGHGHSVDEYLETIYFLAFPIGEYRPATASNAIASRVAEMLGVSRASAGEMLKRLEAEGLVERGEQKEAILTPTGIERAERVVRKHRLIERFLTDFMGYTAAESHVHADELGDTFSDDMVERINERLGYPDRCPHGWPIETDVEQAENAELVSLAELPPGDAAEIVRLAEHDGDLLHWFYDNGFAPGVDGAPAGPRRRPARSSSRSTATRGRSTRSSRRACTCARPPSARRNEACDGAHARVLVRAEAGADPSPEARRIASTRKRAPRDPRRCGACPPCPFAPT